MSEHEPFLVPAKPVLIGGWTGPALADAGGVLGSVAVARERRYDAEGWRLADDLPVLLHTRYSEVRDLFARRMPAHRWIATAEMSGAVDEKVAAALWWCAAHAFLGDLSFKGAYLPWQNVGSAGQKPNTTQWKREPLLRTGPPVQLFHVHHRGDGPQRALTDMRLLDDRYALIDADMVRLPMPWGIVTIELGGAA